MKSLKILLISLLVILLQLPIYAKSKILKQTTIKTVSGEKINVIRTKDGLTFKGYEGKIVLLEFFGYSCPPCKASIPEYNKLIKKYKDKIVVIAVESWDLDDKKIKPYIKAHNIQYKVVSKSGTGKIFTLIKNTTGYARNIVPYLVIFDKNGKFVYHAAVPKFNVVETKIKSLIKNKNQ